MAVPPWIEVGAVAKDTADGVVGEITQVGSGVTYNEPRPEYVWLRPINSDGLDHMAQIDDLEPADS